MSTINSNLDAFPEFTPRSAMQQQLGRSPSQSQQQQQHQSMNLMGQSPFGNPRYNSMNQQQQQQLQQQQNMMALMRSPSNQLNQQQGLRHQFQQQQLNNDVNRQLIASMVQNLSLNPQATALAPPSQSPMLNKLQTPSITPPPSQQSTSASIGAMLPPPNPPNSAPPSTNASTNSSLNHQSSSSSAHRKLFPSNIENNNHHLNNNSNDMVLLNGSTIDNNLNPYQMQQQQHHHMSSSHLNLQQAQQQQLPSAQFQQNDFEPSRIAPSDLANIAHLKRSDSYFMSDELRSEILRKNLLLLAVPSQDIASQLPVQVKEYQNLVPLDNQQINIEHKSRTFTYQTISYKATHIKTNSVYYLKRICGFRYVNQRCIEIVEIWKKIQHANICTLRDVFGTKEFNGDHSIIFVYDYYPGLETLQYRLYNNPNINLKGWANPYNLDGTARPFSAGKTVTGSRSLGLLPEQNVWEYVIQLTSIIRTIHSANLACRIINPSRILVDHKSRLRLSGIAIFDVVDYENSVNLVAQYQQEDLVEFGRLVLALACNSLIAIQKEHINTSVEIISRNYSSDLRNLISHFMTPTPSTSTNNGRVKSINDAMPIIGTRFYTILDNAYTRGDIIENDLSKEIENGRLFRLICKMNIVLERQEMAGDLQWSETGDRYMLKLFRDYVFHQVTPNGHPWVDLSHIIQCLNKFDTGSNDKICLISPDSQNIMIVSYAQLKKCFEKVFNEITSLMNT